MKKLLLSLVAALSVVACTVEHIYEAPDVNVTIDNSSINNNDSNANASAEAYTYQELSVYLPINIGLLDSGYINPDGSIGGEYDQEFEFATEEDEFEVGEDENTGTAYKQSNFITNVFSKAYAQTIDGDVSDFDHVFPDVTATIVFTNQASSTHTVEADFNVRDVATGASTIKVTLPHGRWDWAFDASVTGNLREFISVKSNSIDQGLSPIISVGQPDLDSPATELVLPLETEDSILTINKYGCTPNINGDTFFSTTIDFDGGDLDVFYAYVDSGATYDVTLPYDEEENSGACDATANRTTKEFQTYTHYHYTVIVSYGFADTTGDVLFSLGDYIYDTEEFVLDVPGEQIDFTVLGVVDNGNIDPFTGWYWNEAGDWTHADTDWDITPVFSSNDFGSLESLTVGSKTFTIDVDNDIQSVFEAAFLSAAGVDNPDTWTESHSTGNNTYYVNSTAGYENLTIYYNSGTNGWVVRTLNQVEISPGIYSHNYFDANGDLIGSLVYLSDKSEAALAASLVDLADTQ